MKIIISLNNEFVNSVRENAIVWCRGKDWKLRLPLLIWFVYVLVRHLADPMYNSILAPVNLGIHELGHFIFSIFGQFISMAGGTILQLLAPLFLMINFYRQGDFFAITLCFGWLSTNLFNVATYIADARAMDLPLVMVFGNENVIHDWNYLLSKLGLLQFDTIIAFLVRFLAVLSMLVCLYSGGWLLWKIVKNQIG